MQSKMKSLPNSKLTHYSITREWVIRNSVKDVPCMEKCKCDCRDASLSTYI
ncbi:MAG: hypothetical protein ACQESF_02295 [Nanobdellota archaeon]